MTYGRVIHDLQDLPYVSSAPRDGRLVTLQPFFDVEGGEWHLYAPFGDKSWIRVAGGESISGSYLARGVADPLRDLEFPLGTLVVQHLSFPGPMTELGALENDLHRCAAILEKYQLIWDGRHSTKLAASLLVESELEYLLLLLRSMYDVLQGLIRALCKLFRQIREPSRRAMDDLPESFAAVVMKGHSTMESAAIAARFRMPEALAVWYSKEATFFRELRDLRDGIAHHGQRVSMVFECDWGFAVDPNESPWTRFGPYLSGQRWEGRLASLRGLFAGFIGQAVEAASRLAAVLSGLLVMPEAISEQLHVFVRSPFGHHLTRREGLEKWPWEGRSEPEA